MSWIGPCWLLKIVPWYFLKGKTPHHMHKNLICPTQLLHLYHPPTFPIEAKQCGRKVYIILSGYWGGGSLHTTVNLTYNMHDARCTYHKWNWEIFQLAAHNNHPHRIALAIHEKNNIILSGHWESGWHAIYGGQTYIDAQSDKCKMSVFFSWLHITINLIPQRENWWLIVNWYDGCSWFVSCPEWWLITSDYHRSTYISIEVCIPKWFVYKDAFASYEHDKDTEWENIWKVNSRMYHMLIYSTYTM